MASKIKLNGSLKPKDSLFGGHVAASAEGNNTPRQPAQDRKLPDQKMTSLYPIRLQLPINQQQNLTLTEIVGMRRGAEINKGSVVRALLNLLHGVQFSEADRVSTEAELKNMLRQKLKGI
jgi:hypothetical protein